MRLKYLQLAQYESWLRKATDPEWDEDESRSKPERSAASFALELRDAAERIASLEDALRDEQKAHMEIASALSAVGVETDDGTSVSAAKNAAKELVQARAEIESLHANRRRRSETIREWQRFCSELAKVLGTISIDEEVLAATKQLVAERDTLRSQLEALSKPVSDEEWREQLGDMQNLPPARFRLAANAILAARAKRQALDSLAQQEVAQGTCDAKEAQ